MSSKYLYGVLLVLIALSKEFLVFNEEVLVLLAFSIFIYLLVNYGGEMIAGELDSRKEKIKEVFEISKAEIANIEKFYENSLQNHLVSNFEERLKRVSTNENKTNAALQKEIFTDLRAYLMDSYSVESNKMSKKNRKQLLKNCVEQLKTCY